MPIYLIPLSVLVQVYSNLQKSALKLIFMFKVAVFDAGIFCNIYSCLHIYLYKLNL